MQVALEEAKKALEIDEVPIGAALFDDDDKLITKAHNRREIDQDPTAHAEIEALRDAAWRVGNYRLPGSTLIVTIEPCTMCAGALIHARVGHLIFGAREPRAGAVCSSATVLDNQQLNHQVEVTEGVLADDCSRLMTEFFQSRRH